MVYIRESLRFILPLSSIYTSKHRRRVSVNDLKIKHVWDVRKTSTLSNLLSLSTVELTNARAGHPRRERDKETEEIRALRKA